MSAEFYDDFVRSRKRKRNVECTDDEADKRRKMNTLKIQEKVEQDLCLQKNMQLDLNPILEPANPLNFILKSFEVVTYDPECKYVDKRFVIDINNTTSVQGHVKEYQCFRFRVRFGVQRVILENLIVEWKCGPVLGMMFGDHRKLGTYGPGRWYNYLGTDLFEAPAGILFRGEHLACIEVRDDNGHLFSFEFKMALSPQETENDEQSCVIC